MEILILKLRRFNFGNPEKHFMTSLTHETTYFKSIASRFNVEYVSAEGVRSVKAHLRTQIHKASQLVLVDRLLRKIEHESTP